MSKVFLLVTLLGVLVRSSYAQCSDAGVCSIGHAASSPNHRLSLDYAFGSSGKPDDLRFHSVGLGLSLRVFEGSTLTVTLPYNGQSGPMGAASGIGDITLLIVHNVSDDGGITVQVGGKIATADANAKNLPQAYQSGLGTNDLLFGVGYTFNSWTFAAGYQFSPGRSNNKIDRLKRGDDLLLRAGYGIPLEKANLSAEVLAIKRLARSSVLKQPPSTPEQFVDIPGSDQLQVNLIGRITYPVAETYELHGLVALPTIQRKVNVDGLKRAISLSVALSFFL